MTGQSGHYHPGASRGYRPRELALTVRSSQPPPSSSRGAASPARRLGRRIGQGAYYALVLFVAAAATWQVAREAFFANAEPPPFSTCREGLQALHAAIQRGRSAAQDAAGAPGSEGPSEEAALRRFRAVLQPVWRHRDGVARLCRPSPELRRALDAIERLRYSEEHNVRSQAAELGPLRRRVRRIVEQHLTDEPPR